MLDEVPSPAFDLIGPPLKILRLNSLLDKPAVAPGESMGLSTKSPTDEVYHAPTVLCYPTNHDTNSTEGRGRSLMRGSRSQAKELIGAWKRTIKLAILTSHLPESLLDFRVDKEVTQASIQRLREKRNDLHIRIAFRTYMAEAAGWRPSAFKIFKSIWKEHRANNDPDLSYLDQLVAKCGWNEVARYIQRLDDE